jgi:hypothetical protein
VGGGNGGVGVGPRSHAGSPSRAPALRGPPRAGLFGRAEGHSGRLCNRGLSSPSSTAHDD